MKTVTLSWQDDVGCWGITIDGEERSLAPYGLREARRAAEQKARRLGARLIEQPKRANKAAA
jgi:hypothetical protein